MKKTVLILSSLLLTIPALAVSSTGDAANGKRLYEEHPDKCLSCHAKGEQFSKSDRAKDIKQLEARIRMWDVKTKTNWYEDELKDVTAYLNKRYYHFPATKDGLLVDK